MQGTTRGLFVALVPFGTFVVRFLATFDWPRVSVVSQKCLGPFGLFVLLFVLGCFELPRNGCRWWFLGLV
jgi:hypothetical protein